jgi:hypothetical protein
MTRPDCCGQPAACPAHQNGDCDHPTLDLRVQVDEHTDAFLTSLYGDDWPSVLAAAQPTGSTR